MSYSLLEQKLMDQSIIENRGDDAIDTNPRQHRRWHTQRSQMHTTELSSPDDPKRAPSPALDPTGMFRNRGRRVIAPRTQSSTLTLASRVQKQGGTLLAPSPYDTPSKNDSNCHTILNVHGRRLGDTTTTNDESRPPRIKKLQQSEELRLMPADLHIETINMVGGGGNCPEGPMRREEPENDHPHQSMSHMSRTDSANYSIDKKSEDTERENKQLYSRNNIDTNIRNSMSTVGATVSNMGSIIGNGDYSLVYDDVKSLAAKRRTIQDVEEIVGDAIVEDTHDSEHEHCSLECHADSTDSYLLEHHSINVDDARLTERAAINNSVDELLRKTSNIVKVADFSDSTIAESNSESTQSQNNQEQDPSTFQSAFRRKVRGMSETSAPSEAFLSEPYAFLRKTSSERLKRVSPAKFQLSAASSAIDKAVTTAGMLPQLARQCFSFEDTAVDDDTFLAMPDQLHLAYRPAVGNLLSCGELPQLDSPFRVIRESQTWSGSLPQASSIDTWSPTTQGGSNKVEKKKKNTEDWKKLEMERGDAINLLACMVEHLSNFEHKEIEGYYDDLESDKLKLIASSIKEISAVMIDVNAGPSGEQPITVNHQMRSDFIDTLLLSHEFALEAKRSSQSANKWLQSIGCSKTDITSNQHAVIYDVECFALRARLNVAENSLSCKQEEICRLNEELSSCRSEIGRLKSSSFQSQQQPMPLSMNQSILSSSSSHSDSYSSDSIIETGESLVLGPTVKLCASPSLDESFIKWEKDIENQMNLECRKEILLLKAALEQANRKISALERTLNEPFTSDIEPINAPSDGGREELFMKIAADIESEAPCSPISGQYDHCMETNMSTGSPAIKLDDPALQKELEDYRQALIVSLEHDRTPERADSVLSSDDPNLAQDLSKSHSSEKMISVRMIDGENFSTEWSDLVDLPPPPDHGLHSPIVDAVLQKWSDDDDTRSSLMGWLEDILNGSKSVQSVPSLKLSGLDHQTRDGFTMHVLPLLLRRKDIHVHLTSRVHRRTTYDMAVSVTPTSVGVRKNDRLSDFNSDDVESRHVQLSSKYQLMAFQATKNGSSIKENGDLPRSPNRLLPILSKPFVGRSVPALVRSHSNAGSVSTAVTTPMSNRTPTRGPLMARVTDGYTSFSEMKKPPRVPASLGDDLSVGSSAVDDENKESQRQSSLIGSMLGRLSRRKAYPVDNDFLDGTPIIGISHSSMHQSPKHESSEEELPYHRIVSAPPGKIGISFVEYRGHAMVSNVLDDSPLVGWVFPSDVLVAIDDVPVSGLRTREIVKLLTNRIKQQRNLRMVSAVSMNKLSIPGAI